MEDLKMTYKNCLLTKKQAAEILGISTRTIDRYRAAGALRAATKKVGPRMVRFRLAEVQKIVERGVR